jgi:flagellar biosynthesis component FlhA
MTASVIVSETPVLKSITLTAIVSAVGTQSFAAQAIDQFNNMISSVVTWASSNPSVGTINGSALVIVMEPSTTLVKDSSKENKENKEEKEHKEDKEHKDGKGDLEEDDED